MPNTPKTNLSLAVAKAVMPQHLWQIDKLGRIGVKIADNDFVFFDHTTGDGFKIMSLWLAMFIQNNPTNAIWTGNIHGLCLSGSALLYLLNSTNPNIAFAEAITSIVITSDA